MTKTTKQQRAKPRLAEQIVMARAPPKVRRWRGIPPTLANKCPTCGGPKSHGVSGNPNHRRWACPFALPRAVPLDPRPFPVQGVCP